MTSSPNVSSSLSIQIDQASQATKLLMLLALFSLFSASKCCPSCPMSPGADWNFDWLFRAATQRSWLLSTVIAVVLHPDSPNALTFCCEWCFPMCPFRIVFILHLGKEGTDGNGWKPAGRGKLDKKGACYWPMVQRVFEWTLSVFFICAMCNALSFQEYDCPSCMKTL